MKMIEAQGAQLATESFGGADRGTILLVMGATASMVWWPVAFCRVLAARGYRVIRFDLRDTGQSSTGEPGRIDYDLTDMADDLLAILDGYGVNAAHLVGMSLGGMLVQMTALTAPERVLSLTLIASEPLGLKYEGEGMSPELLKHFGAAEGLDWDDRQAVRDFMLTSARLCAGSAVPFEEGVALARIDLEMRRARDIRGAFNHGMIRGEIGPELTATQLALPVLIIHGTEDPVIGFGATEAMERAVGDARLVALEGRGHEITRQDEARIAEEILKFVGGQDVGFPPSRG